MKNLLLLLLLLIPTQLSAQSVTILPTSTPTVSILSIKKNGIGLDHRNNIGSVGVGTYAGVTEGYVQTHTNHPLAFSTNDSGVQVILKTNGYFGIGTDNPQHLLDITQRARIRTSGKTAGIWFSKSNNNVEEGAFFGNLSDTQTGIYIGNNWRFSVNDAGVINVPNLAGTGTRNVGADANGNLVALMTPSAGTVGFSVALNSPSAVEVSGDGTPTYIQGNTEYNIGNAWNGSIFTAPSAGLYHFSIKILWQGKLSGSRLIMLSKNNLDIKGSYDTPTDANPFRQQFTTTLYLNANDTISLRISQNSAGYMSAFGDLLDKTVFSGHKIN
jgi:hypothetical protein